LVAEHVCHPPVEQLSNGQAVVLRREAVVELTTYRLHLRQDFGLRLAETVLRRTVPVAV
jgi:hypothetical protein